LQVARLDGQKLLTAADDALHQQATLGGTVVMFSAPRSATGVNGKAYWQMDVERSRRAQMT
jgi:hypothetical protein